LPLTASLAVDTPVLVLFGVLGALLWVESGRLAHPEDASHDVLKVVVVSVSITVNLEELQKHVSGNEVTHPAAEAQEDVQAPGRTRP
jgi:hypothetical protein